MKEFSTLFEIEDIKKYLIKLKKKEYQKEYLWHLRKEFTDICYYFTDNDIDKYLKENNLTNKYKRDKYNRYADFEQTHISNSEYRKFLRHIDGLLQFVISQMYKLKIKPNIDDDKISKDYKIFNYDTQQVLDYSNGLGKEKIPYLLWILQDYYRNTLEYLNNTIPIPVIKGKYISPESSIISSEFSTKIHQRLQMLKENPNVKIFNSSAEYMKALKKIELEQLFENNKDLYNFDFNKIKKHSEKYDKLEDRLLYLERVKKEEAQNRILLGTDDFVVQFSDKMDKEIKYVEKLIKIKKEDNSINNNETSEKSKSNMAVKDKFVVQWKGEDSDLYYILNEFERSGFLTEIDKRNFIELIKIHFVDKHGIPFKTKRITQGFNNLLLNKGNKSKNAYKVDNIIEKINRSKKQ